MSNIIEFYKLINSFVKILFITRINILVPKYDVRMNIVAKGYVRKTLH